MAALLVVSSNASASSTYIIRSALGGVLDVQWASPEPGTPIHLWPHNGGLAQQWELIDAGGSFFVRSALGTMLDVRWAETEPGTPVHTWEMNAGPAQRWLFQPAGDGSYFIQSELGQYLDVQWANPAEGTPIWTWPYTGTHAQKWYLEPVSTSGAVTAPLSARADSKWPAAGAITPIDVCWENPTSADSRDRDLVRDAVTRTWQRNSGVRFNWSTAACPRGRFNGIRIRIADEGPRTHGLGRFLAGIHSGMVLNFTFARWSPTCAASRNRRTCIESIDIHEFGHALGFTHEHNRSDCAFPCADAACTNPCTDGSCAGICLDEPQGPEGDLVLTDCDARSIMNYCFDSGFRNALSTHDIEGVRAMYGSGPRASSVIELRSFRLPNVPGLCPVGASRGDREFFGGPLIHSSVRLSIASDGSGIDATTTITFAEPKADFSTTSSTATTRLWTVEPGKRIAAITSPTFSEVAFRGGAAGAEFLICGDGAVHSVAPEGSGNAARIFHIIGDTGAEDISHDTNCHCDARLESIELNSVTLRIESI